MGACLRCGKLFPRNARGRPRKFCSPACQVGHFMGSVPTGSEVVETCKSCHREFRYTAVRGRLRRYCSVECGSWVNRPPRAATIASTCARCGSTFEATAKVGRSQRYCSVACGYRGDDGMPRRKACRLCGQIFEPLKSQRACNDCQPREKACPVCRGTFSNLSDPSQRFCSRPCQWAAQRKTQPCEVCGTQYSPKIGGANMRNGTTSRWCSRTCQATAYQRRARLRIHMAVVTPCVVCSAPMANTPKLYRVCCSDACRREWASRVATAAFAAAKVVQAVVCKICQKEFKTEYGNKRRVFCSDRCSQKAADEAKRLRKYLTLGTGLRVSDLPAEYVEAVKAYRQLKQELRRNSNQPSWKN